MKVPTTTNSKFSFVERPSEIECNVEKVSKFKPFFVIPFRWRFIGTFTRFILESVEVKRNVRHLANILVNKYRKLVETLFEKTRFVGKL